MISAVIPALSALNRFEALNTPAHHVLLRDYCLIKANSSLEPARSGVSSQGNQAAELTSMWVAPEVRGNGDGRALVEAVQGWVRDDDLQLLPLDVFEENAVQMLSTPEWDLSAVDLLSRLENGL